VGPERPRARRGLARGGIRPSSEVEKHLRGRQALERGGDYAVRRSVHERGGDSPEGYRGRSFGGPLWLLGPWVLLCAGLRPRRACFGDYGYVCLRLLLFEKGIFPSY
jgi:hypothetical protein